MYEAELIIDIPAGSLRTYRYHEQTPEAGYQACIARVREFYEKGYSSELIQNTYTKTAGCTKLGYVITHGGRIVGWINVVPLKMPKRSQYVAITDAPEPEKPKRKRKRSAIPTGDDVLKAATRSGRRAADDGPDSLRELLRW